MTAAPRRRKYSRAGMALALPYLLLGVAFGVVPVIIAVVQSIQVRMRAKGMSLIPDGGGLENFRRVMFDDPSVPTAALHVGIFVVIYVPLMVAVVAALALLLDSFRARWHLALRVAFIVPACITGSVAVLVWWFMLEPTYSPFGSALRAAGLHSSSDVWATPNLTAIFVLMAFFTGAGNWIVVQYGSLQSISDEVIEAAKIDGANAFQVAVQIKLPLISKYLIYMAILCFAAAVQIFVEPQLIDKAFNGRAGDWSLSQRAFTLAFGGGNQLTLAAALSVLMLIVCVIVALIAIFKTNFFDEALVSRTKPTATPSEQP